MVSNVRSGKKSQIAVATVAVVGIVGVSGCLISEIRRVHRTPIGKVNLSAIPDGAYKGKSTFMKWTFEVEIAMKNRRIEKIDALQDDGRKYGRKARGVLERVVEKQSLEVDAVTGATTSSRVFLHAVYDALKPADGGAKPESGQ